MLEIYEILDRFEILYPDNEDIANLRRAYVDKDLPSIFKVVRDDEVGDYGDLDELRKAVVEENLYSIFRVLGRYVDDEFVEELRSAVTENNLHSIFRIMETVNGDDTALDNLRRAVTEKNTRCIFRLVAKFNVPEVEDLRAAVTEKNLHSLFRLIDDEDLRKVLLEDNMWSLWKLLERYVDTQFVPALKSLISVNEVKFSPDCMSRGQLASKRWLVRTVEDFGIDLGTVFLCAGWYGILSTMMFESKVKFDKIRSFDIDPTTVDIAKTFNKPWVMDDWRFQSIAEDIHNINFKHHTFTVHRANGTTAELTETPNTVINTSCEHIENFDAWWEKIPAGMLVILQNNDFVEHDDDSVVNTITNVDEFAEKLKLSRTIFKGTLALEKYNRFMIIGRK